VIVKVCGMRYPDNRLALQQVPGVHWMGLILHPASPRAVPLEPLPEDLGEGPGSSPRQELRGHAPSSMQRVGVLVDESLERALQAASILRLDRLQLHGSESPAYCRQLRERCPLPLIKAFRIGPDFSFAACEPYHGICEHFLFDTAGARPGGNGLAFDWNLLSAYTGPTPFLLAGGLRPADAERLAAFRHAFWAGIDLNSGFESQPGRKDLSLLPPFLASLA
jgi:phosphoribosylanthranilate isomerase